jgi:hypothetical protein
MQYNRQAQPAVSTNNSTFVPLGISIPVAANQVGHQKYWFAFSVGSVNSQARLKIFPSVALPLPYWQQLNICINGVTGAIVTATQIVNPPALGFAFAVTSIGSHMAFVDIDFIWGPTAGTIDLSIVQVITNAAPLTFFAGNLCQNVIL